MNKYKKLMLVISISLLIITIICGWMIISSNMSENDITAQAEESGKQFKWAKKAVEKDVTIDAKYLWPNETNPVITDIYRNGKSIVDEKMITVTAGNIYHFHGISDESVLYTEVYVGSISTIDVTSGETGKWYQLLPSVIRDDFEQNNWTWETGWEYTGRAYLDSENNRIMIKNDDPTAVLYGMGLYLNNKYGYSNDKAFIQEEDSFKNTFGDTENIFASALEYYHTRGGELNDACPLIYAFISDVLSGPDTVVIQQNENNSESTFTTDMLNYVNEKRIQTGLNPVIWDSANDNNIVIRMQEYQNTYEQTSLGMHTYPKSAYTDTVMYEIFLDNVHTIEDIYFSSESYFLMEELISFNCIIQDGLGVLILTW